MMNRSSFYMLSCAAVALMFAAPLSAQEAAETTAQPAPVTEPAAAPALEQPAATAQPQDPSKPVFQPDEYKSLVFTEWEHAVIKEAKTLQGDTRAVSQYELDKAMSERPAETKVKPPPEEREIRLSGIVYHGGDDWTIWLNEQRVTPDAIPKEVTDLKVYKSYIEFKWFDDYTNQIFPIRLRPHQRFNIDTRIFLPG